MLSSRECWLLALLVVGVASVTQDSMNPNVWKEAALKGIEAECQEGDVVACVRAKFMRTMDNFLTKDSFKLSDTVSVVARKSSADEEGANNLFGDEDQSVADSWVSRALHFLRTHDVQLQTAAGRATVSSRALDAGRLDVSLQFEDAQGEGEDRDEGRSKIKKKLKKSKLKKLIVPVMVLLLLKALTVIPLIIGVLGMKAFNALQLGFGSFTISLALAIFQLCMKLMSRDSPPAPAQLFAAHPAPGGWEARVNALGLPPIVHHASAPAPAASSNPQHPDELAYHAYHP